VGPLEDKISELEALIEEKDAEIAKLKKDHEEFKKGQVKLSYAKETMTDKVFFRSESEVVVKKSAIPEPEPVKEIVVVQAAPDVEVMARDS
jgi:hypothetical protein